MLGLEIRFWSMSWPSYRPTGLTLQQTLSTRSSIPSKKSVGSTFKEKLTFISECGLLLLLPRLLSLLCCGCCCGVGVLWREGPWATHGLSDAHPHSAELQHAARTRPLHITAGATHIRITGFGSSMSGLGAEAITGHDHSYCHDFRDYHPCIS